MKKFISLFLAIVLCISFVGCGQIGGGNVSTGSSEVSAPAEKVDMLSALVTTPDVNMKDGWYYEMFSRNKEEKSASILAMGDAIPNVEDYENKTYTYYQIYDAAISVGTDEEKSVEFKKEINMDEFFEHLGFGNMGFLVNGEYTGKREDYVGTSSDDIHAGKRFEKTDIGYRINNRYDWAKYNGFLANTYNDVSRWEKGFDELPFAVDPEKGKANFEIVNKELSDLTENYLRAKFEGTELTTPTSKHFNEFTSLDKAIGFLKDQSITPDTVSFEITEMLPNIFTTYPSVVVEYAVTNKDTGERINVRNIFYYEIEKVSDSEFKYNLEYIADYTAGYENSPFMTYDDYKMSLYTCQYPPIEY